MASMLRVAADSEPTASELDRWQEDLEARLGWDVEPPLPAVPPSMLERFRTFLAPLAAACALALVTVGMVAIAPRSTPAPEWQARGGVDAAKGGSMLVDLELSAVRIGDEAAPAARRLGDGDVMAMDEFLQLRYRSHGRPARHLYLLGFDARLQPMDYYPRPTDQRSISIQEALSPRSAGRSIRLAKRHQPGTLWVLGLFSAQPLERKAVHRWFHRLSLQGFNPAQIQAGALGDGVTPVVRRITLQGMTP